MVVGGIHIPIVLDIEVNDILGGFGKSPLDARMFKYLRRKLLVYSLLTGNIWPRFFLGQTLRNLVLTWSTFVCKFPYHKLHLFALFPIW